MQTPLSPKDAFLLVGVLAIPRDRQIRKLLDRTPARDTVIFFGRRTYGGSTAAGLTVDQRFVSAEPTGGSRRADDRLLARRPNRGRRGSSRSPAPVRTGRDEVGRYASVAGRAMRDPDQAIDREVQFTRLPQQRLAHLVGQMRLA